MSRESKNRIHLVGVNHDYQSYWTDAAIAMSRGPEPHRKFKDALRKALRGIAQGGHVRVLREEAGSGMLIPRAIEAGHVSVTVLQGVAGEADLDHGFLPELTDEDVARLKLPGVRDADLNEDQKRLKHEDRERRWGEHLFGVTSGLGIDDELVVVCGSKHLDSLAARLHGRFAVETRDTIREFGFEPDP